MANENDIDGVIRITVRNMSRLAVNPKLTEMERLRAMEILLNVANSGHPAGLDAKVTLKRLTPFLAEVLESPRLEYHLTAIAIALSIASLDRTSTALGSSV